MRRLLCGLPACALAGFAVPVWADDSSTQYTLEIEQQPIVAALTEFSRQTGLQVGYLPESPEEENAIAAPLKGQYTLESALKEMLRPSGLGFERVNERTVSVGAEAGERGRHDRDFGSGPIGDAISTSVRFRVASLNYLDQVSGAAAASESRGHGTVVGQAAAVTGEGAQGRKRQAVEEIVVTGTHIRGAKIVQPFFSITRDKIDKAGFTTVEELAAKLPQNFNMVTPLGQLAGELSNNTVAFRNSTRVTAIDLRGLGAESTLTLINGRRRAGSVFGSVFDISTIPLSTIERVEVLTGGASSVYGADAVAGVVNIITRRTFDGMESRVSYGGPTEYGGGNVLQASHTWGGNFERGSLVAAYDYEQRWASNLLDTGHHSTLQLPDGRRFLSRPLEADLKRNSAYVAGRLSLGDRAELYGDVFYTDKDVEQRQVYVNGADGVEAPLQSHVVSTLPAESYGGAVGMKIDAGAGWAVDVGGAYSYNNAQQTHVLSDYFVDPAFDLINISPAYGKGTVSSFTAIADGPLASVWGTTPRAALGVEYRNEEFAYDVTSTLISVLTGESLPGFGVHTDPPDRSLRSVFAQLNVPFVEQGGPGLRRLELSLGARLDDYSDFGSSFDWSSGLAWQPSADLTLRGSYGTATRTPSIHDASGAFASTPSSLSVAFMQGPDPAAGGAVVPMMRLVGQLPLAPEEAVSWTVGADYTPYFMPAVKLSASWFSIGYDNRIGAPVPPGDQLPLWLTFESAVASLTTRKPTLEQVQAILDARTRFFDYRLPDGTILDYRTTTAQQLLDLMPDLIIIDNRTRNIHRETLKGLDLRLDTDFDTRLGHLSFGIDATYTSSHDRVVTAAAPAISQIDKVAFPTSFRGRARLGWSGGPWGAYLHVNYTPGYDNPFPPPPGIAYEPNVSSWTTADLTLRFDGRSGEDNSLLDGVSMSLSISNLFDTDPPYWSGNESMGRDFDSANASPLGRFATISLTKKW